MHLQESGEMYLETIYILSKNNTNVRAVDVSEHMGYSKPSVSRAVGILKKAGYLTTDKNGYLILTDIGIEAAEKTYERHNTLKMLIMSLGVSEETASEDACKVEHVISDETFEAFKRHLAEKGTK